MPTETPEPNPLGDLEVLLAEIPELAGKQSLELRVRELGACAAVRDDPKAAADALERWLAKIESSSVPGSLWLFAAELYLRADRLADARGSLEGVFATTGPEDGDTLARAHIAFGILEARGHRWEQAVEAWNDALRLAPRGGDDELTLHALLGEAWEALGVPDQASAHLSEGLRIAATKRDVRRECELLVKLGQHSLARGWIDSAAGYLRQCLGRAREEAFVAGEAAAEISLADISLEVGEIDDALRGIERGLAGAREVGDPLLTVAALEKLAEVKRRSRDLDGARSALEEAVFLARRAGSHAAQAGLYHMLALVHESGGKLSLALSAYEKALVERRRAGDAAGLGATLNNIGSLHAKLGDAPQAQKLYREAILAFGECGHERRELEIVIENLKRLDRETAEAAPAPAPVRGVQADDAPTPIPFPIDRRNDTKSKKR